MNLIFTALPIEGRAFIDYFKLSHIPKEPFDIYKNNALALVITGTGSVNTAIAIAYIYGKYKDLIDANSTFINYGTAGANNLDIGSLYLAHTVTTEGHKKIFYPDNITPFQLPEKKLITSDTPVTEGEANTLYDMEAYGFCQACDKFLLTHQYAILKSVSDNLSNDFFDKKAIKILAEKSIPYIEKLISYGVHTEVLTKEERRAIEDFFDRAGFSFSQKEALMPLFAYYKLNNNKVTIFLENYATIYAENKTDRNQIFNHVRQSLISA